MHKATCSISSLKEEKESFYETLMHLCFQADLLVILSTR